MHEAPRLDWLPVMEGIPLMGTRFRFEALEHELELDECLHMQAREKPFRVAAGLVILAIVVLAVLGWAGDGKLSIHEIRRADAALQYPRVVRLGKDFVLDVRAGNGPLAIQLPNDYLRHFRLRDIVPPPAQAQLSAEGITLRFDGSDAAAVRLYLEPERMGRQPVSLRVGAETFTFRQLVLP